MTLTRKYAGVRGNDVSAHGMASALMASIFSLEHFEFVTMITLYPRTYEGVRSFPDPLQKRLALAMQAPEARPSDLRTYRSPRR